MNGLRRQIILKWPICINEIDINREPVSLIEKETMDFFHTKRVIFTKLKHVKAKLEITPIINTCSIKRRILHTNIHEI